MLDFRLHIYDTTVPISPARGIYRNREMGHETSMKLIKSIRAYADRWTITDSHLSPDNQRFVSHSCGYLPFSSEMSNLQHDLRHSGGFIT